MFNFSYKSIVVALALLAFVSGCGDTKGKTQIRSSIRDGQTPVQATKKDEAEAIQEMDELLADSHLYQTPVQITPEYMAEKLARILGKKPSENISWDNNSIKGTYYLSYVATHFVKQNANSETTTAEVAKDEILKQALTFVRARNENNDVIIDNLGLNDQSVEYSSATAEDFLLDRLHLKAPLMLVNDDKNTEVGESIELMVDAEKALANKTTLGAAVSEPGTVDIMGVFSNAQTRISEDFQYEDANSLGTVSVKTRQGRILIIKVSAPIVEGDEDNEKTIGQRTAYLVYRRDMKKDRSAEQKARAEKAESQKKKNK